MIEIKNRYTGATILSADVPTLKAALEKAIKDGANLTGANLYGANLYGANLTGANLYGANLYGANLYGANLTGASLTGARNIPAGLDYLKPVREDIRAVLDSAPNEAPGLLAKLFAGEVDGSVYEGACACLVGTIANIRGVAYTEIEGLRPNSERPAEVWFLRISNGSTPLTNTSAAYAAVVIQQWMAERAARVVDGDSASAAETM